MEFENYVIKDAGNFDKLKLLYPYIKNKKCCIAGGVFKDIFQNQEFKDIDIFFESEFDFMIEKGQHSSNDLLTKVYENENAIGLYDNSKGISIDLVQKKFGSPKEILDSFDFTVSKFCLYQQNNNFNVIYHKHFFEDLTTKTLRFDCGTLNPIAQLSRAIKYSRYGFKLSKIDFLNLLREVNNLDNDVFNDLSMDNFYSYY